MSEAKFTTAYSDLAGFTGIKRNGEDIGLDEATTLLNDMYEVLRQANMFITNGVELGYIQMPDKDLPDPAHDIPPMIKAALAKARANRQPQQGLLNNGGEEYGVCLFCGESECEADHEEEELDDSWFFDGNGKPFD